MKVQLVLFAGALTGLSLIATPALSQDSTRQQPPPSRPPSAMPGMDNTFRQAVSALEGSWSLSVKTFASGAGAQTPSSEAQGTSTRKWMLNDKILVEDVRCNKTPASTGAAGNESLGSENFLGHGMFGYDKDANEFQHVWSDSTDNKIAYSSGRYDERTRTFTFNMSGGMSSMPGRTTPPATPPTSSPPPRPTPPGARDVLPGEPDNHSSANFQATPPPTTPPTTTPPRPGQPSQPPPSTTTPPGRTTGDQPVNLGDVQKIVLRVLDNDRHTVEYFGGAGGTNKIMEITYTRSR